MLEPAVREVLLAFADDELMMGHRHSEWLGVAPFLEEDLAHASIAQDELGHARALYGLLTDDVDAFGFARDPTQFRSSWFVELPCRAWEEALARHFLYDLAEQVRWQDLQGTSLPEIAGIAAKALREEEYHRVHAVSLVQRLLGGTDESRRLVLGALNELYPMARALFEPVIGGPPSSRSGLADPPDLEGAWIEMVAGSLREAEATLDFDAPPRGYGGRRGLRSEHFSELHGTMTAVYAIDPGAAW